jgi:glycosyltransferase 2 family protein
LKLSNRLKIGLLGVAVSLLALYFIAVQVDFELFLEAWRSARYVYLLPCVAFLLAGLVTRALRWRVLLNGDLPLARAFSIMNVAYLVNGILPLRIGEFARVYLAARVRKPVPIPKTTGTIIVERILDLLSVVMMALIAIAFGAQSDELKTASGIAAVIAIIGFSVLVSFAIRREWAMGLLRLMMRIVPFLKRYPVLEEWLEQFLDGLLPLARFNTLAQTLFWTVISWMFSIAAGYVLMFAFFEQASATTTMLYIAAAAFAIALPAVPGNIGTYEASILLALYAMGYEQSEVAVAFAVMVHAVNVVVHSITGAIGFVQEGISLTQLSEGVQQMQETTTEVGLLDR